MVVGARRRLPFFYPGVATEERRSALVMLDQIAAEADPASDGGKWLSAVAAEVRTHWAVAERLRPTD